MIWKKLKRLIIPLIIVKLVFMGIFIYKTDFITISRDITYSTGNMEGLESDSTVQKKQKLIRIIRNKEEGSFSIKLRSRKNDKPLLEKEEETSLPRVD